MALKPYIILTCQQQTLIFHNGYQLLTVIIVKHKDRGKYYVSFKVIFTTLTIIISLMAASFLAIQRYGHSRRDDKGCKGSIYGLTYSLHHPRGVLIVVKYLLLAGVRYNLHPRNMSTPRVTLPRQWSLITISQDNHSFHPMFRTDWLWNMLWWYSFPTAKECTPG